MLVEALKVKSDLNMKIIKKRGNLTGNAEVFELNPAHTLSGMITRKSTQDTVKYVREKNLEVVEVGM